MKQIDIAKSPKSFLKYKEYLKTSTLDWQQVKFDKKQPNGGTFRELKKVRTVRDFILKGEMTISDFVDIKTRSWLFPERRFAKCETLIQYIPLTLLALGSKVGTCFMLPTQQELTGFCEKIENIISTNFKIYDNNKDVLDDMLFFENAILNRWITRFYSQQPIMLSGNNTFLIEQLNGRGIFLESMDKSDIRQRACSNER